MSEVILIHLSREEYAALQRLPNLEQFISQMIENKKKENISTLSRKDLLSPTQVAELCGCHPETVRKAVVMGKLQAIPVQKTRGGRPGFVVERAAAQEWLMKGRPLK